MEKISLTYTGQASVAKAYGSLPKTGELMLHVSRHTLEAGLNALEAEGFCGMFVHLPDPGEEFAAVSAYKGKQGPCYDTGRYAVYRGVAKAALDDDNHLLIAERELPVCEKTANVYRLPTYKERVDISPPQPKLLDRLATDPVVFDCNTFEEDMAGLFEMLCDTDPEDDRCLLYYPGPFRFLILEDGSVVRRGKLNNVPASLKEKLLEQEGFAGESRWEQVKAARKGLASEGSMVLGDEAPEGLTRTDNEGPNSDYREGQTGNDREGQTEYNREAATRKLIFKDMYRESGPAFFIYSGPGIDVTDGTSDQVIPATPAATTDQTIAWKPAGASSKAASGTPSETTSATIANGGKTDFSVLRELKKGMKDRLAGVIRDNRKYFILTGSDPEIEWGCCPSDEVAEAGRLVRAGILSSYAQPVPEDACPLTTFAFKNEMEAKEDGIQFTPDPGFRKKVLHHLERKPVSRAGHLLRWVLLVFVLASLVLAVYRATDKASVPNDITLYEQLSPVSSDQFMIVLFHFRERCETCLNMERYTRDFLEAYNQGKDQESQVQFSLEVINDDRNVNLVRRFNLYTSTLVLVKFENGSEEQVKVLSNAWQLYRDEDAYKAMLANEIMSFMQQLNG